MVPLLRERTRFFIRTELFADRLAAYPKRSLALAQVELLEQGTMIDGCEEEPRASARVPDLTVLFATDKVSSVTASGPWLTAPHPLSIPSSARRRTR